MIFEAASTQLLIDAETTSASKAIAMPQTATEIPIATACGKNDIRFVTKALALILKYSVAPIAAPPAKKPANAISNLDLFPATFFEACKTSLSACNCADA